MITKFCLLVFATVTVASAMPGGFSGMDISADTTIAKAEEAHREIQQKQLKGTGNGDFRRRVIKVISARSQVVAGINYDLVFYDGQTQCSIKVCLRFCLPDA